MFPDLLFHTFIKCRGQSAGHAEAGVEGASPERPRVACGGRECAVLSGEGQGPEQERRQEPARHTETGTFHAVPAAGGLVCGRGGSSDQLDFGKRNKEIISLKRRWRHLNRERNWPLERGRGVVGVRPGCAWVGRCRDGRTRACARCSMRSGARHGGADAETGRRPRGLRPGPGAHGRGVRSSRVTFLLGEKRLGKSEKNPTSPAL